MLYNEGCMQHKTYVIQHIPAQPLRLGCPSRRCWRAGVTARGELDIDCEPGGSGLSDHDSDRHSLLPGLVPGRAVNGHSYSADAHHLEGWDVPYNIIFCKHIAT